MAHYSFVTIWRHHAPIDAVYDAIADSLHWPDWWPAVLAVEELVAGDPVTLVGTVRRCTFKGSLPYRLTFDATVTNTVRPHTLVGTAAGELEGTGVWTLTEEPDGVTAARYDWSIQTNRWWMNLLAPLAGGLFKTNHDFVMRAGAAGLCTRLGGVSGTCSWLGENSVASEA